MRGRSRAAWAGQRAALCAAAALVWAEVCSAQTCVTPSDPGYTLVETSVEAGSFDVAAGCAPGYEGSATVAPCSTAGPYGVSGCTGESRVAPPRPPRALPPRARQRHLRRALQHP